MFFDSELSTFGIPCLTILPLLSLLIVSRVDLIVTVNTCVTVLTVRISSSEEISRHYIAYS